MERLLNELPFEKIVKKEMYVTNSDELNVVSNTFKGPRLIILNLTNYALGHLYQLPDLDHVSILKIVNLTLSEH